MSSIIKDEVLQALVGGKVIEKMPKDKWRIGGKVIHVRFRSHPKSRGCVFSYNINPNTLSSDYELWICHDATNYYLFPTAVMKHIYDDTETYVDKTHPDIRVAEVDISNHRLLHGRGGKSLDATEYYCCTFVA